jgi:bacteriocin-type transport-associated protein
MADVLLTELSNADIDWIATTGQRQELAAGTVLLQPCQIPDAIYLLLEGVLTVSTNDENRNWQIQLQRGEIVGETFILNLPPMLAIVKAEQPALVLAISQRQLTAKLQQDRYFAAHFYRAIALILAERLRQILEMPGQLQVMGEVPVKEALFMFAELRDSDIDWLVSAGQVEKLAPDKILIHAGRPIDALYIILDGLLSLLLPEGDCDPLSLCFKGLEQTRTYQKAIAHLSRGEVVGAISFLDFRPLPATVRTAKESLVLAISRQQLATKLQQDMGFAARFYRMLAIQLSNSLQGVMGRMGCSQHTYNRFHSMDAAVEYDDELDIDALGSVSQGAARFNWMLKRLGMCC